MPASLDRIRKAGNHPVPQDHICHGALLPSSVCLRPSTTTAALIQINACVSSENSFVACTNNLPLICKGNFSNKRGKAELVWLAATRPPAPAKTSRLYSPGLPVQLEASTVSQSCPLKPLSLERQQHWSIADLCRDIGPSNLTWLNQSQGFHGPFPVCLMRPSTLHLEAWLYQGPTLLPVKYPCPVSYLHCPLTNFHQLNPCWPSMLQTGEALTPTSWWSPRTQSMHISLSLCMPGIGHPALQCSTRTSQKNTA